MTTRHIEFRAVSKNYGGHSALSNVSFAIAAGEHTAIIGPSGSGKSTLLRLLCGLDTPCKGTILIDGNTVSEVSKIVVPPHQRSLAMVFQDLALWPNLSVIANIELGLAGQRLARKKRTERAREALVLSGIGELASRKPGQISGGQQQRVALARAIAVRPDFLLLDEPFAGIDLVEKSRLINEIGMMVANHRMTVLMVSHDPVEAASICEKAIVLDRGELRETGDLTGLMAGSPTGIFQAARGLYDRHQAAENP